jgi:hypothetical protein
MESSSGGQQQAVAATAAVDAVLAPAVGGAGSAAVCVGVHEDAQQKLSL